MYVLENGKSTCADHTSLLHVYVENSEILCVHCTFSEPCKFNVGPLHYNKAPTEPDTLYCRRCAAPPDVPMRPTCARNFLPIQMLPLWRRANIGSIGRLFRVAIPVIPPHRIEVFLAAERKFHLAFSSLPSDSANSCNLRHTQTELSLASSGSHRNMCEG